MTIDNNILIANIWCHDQQLKDMGVDSSLWLDFGIDLRSVFAIKLNGDGETEFEKEAEKKATLYTANGVFTVDVDYQELFPEWVKIRNRA